MSKELLKLIWETKFRIEEYLPKIEEIIKNGADVNYKDENNSYKNWTALHHCAQVGAFFLKYEQIAAILVDNGANINEINNNNETPTELALLNCNISVFEYLTKSGGKIFEDSLFVKILEKYIEEKELDEEHGTDESLNRFIKRVKAIVDFDENIIENNIAIAVIMFINEDYLPKKTLYNIIDIGIDLIGEKEQRPFYHALHYKMKSKAIVKIAKKIGIEFQFKEYNNLTPIELASAFGNLKVVKKLSELGAKQIKGAIERAKKNEQTEIFEYLETL